MWGRGTWKGVVFENGTKKALAMLTRGVVVVFAMSAAFRVLPTSCTYQSDQIQCVGHAARDQRERRYLTSSYLIELS